MSAELQTDRSSLPVELDVNGKKVRARSGQTILDVVREQDLDEIPTLCHDPKLEPYGSCFLCVVEVKGAPRLVPACVTRVRDGMEVTTQSARISHARKTALELLLSDHYADCVCPAQAGCPAGVDVQGYLSLARLGYYRESLALIRERNPLPVVCGRVCVRRCEVKCHRNQVDEPVGINFVKRYVSASGRTERQVPGEFAESGKRVAVVGGGPAGLTCAYYLARNGHLVTIFEALPKLGGMLRYGIPEYRLPRPELNDEIQGILDLGVKAEVGKALGRDFTIESLLQKERYDAVFLALGAPLGKKMGVNGEDRMLGVRPALDFLRDVELKGVPALRGRVAVIGGGNSAIDAARTALRCGAEEVTILYRRTRNEMPAHHEEVEAAEKEGVKLEFLVAPVELRTSNGSIHSVRCQRMKLGEPDAGGRRKPVPIEGALIDFACEHLFAAIGQDTDFAPLKGEPEVLRPRISRWSTIDADPATMATSVKGLFAGGDVVKGPSAVIDAVAQGRIAAQAIDGYLRTGEVRKQGTEFRSRRDFFGAVPDWVFEEVERTKRSIMPERDARERTADFAQVDIGLAEPEMRIEAFRCMECGCKSVFECDLKRYAAEYGVDIARFAGEVRRHRIDRSHPLLTLDPNKCILCGRCVRTCADIVGLAVFGFIGRGFATVVRPALGRPLAESACIACGACVESCPTGALEARLAHGRQGPWKASRIPSICTFCSIGCELTLNVVSDGLLWAGGSDKSIRSRGELCVRGRFGTGLIHGQDRLRVPLIRKHGELVEAAWEEAISAAASTLDLARRRHGPEAVAVMAAPRMTLEETLLARHLAATVLGTSRTGSFGQNLRGGPRLDLDDIIGETASTCTLDDICSADLILLAGADPSATHPVLAMSIRRAARQGAEIVAVNSGHIDLLRPHDLWLDARRGTAGILFAAVLNLLLKSGRIDARNIGPAVLAALRASVSRAVLDEAANLSGVAPAKIEALAGKLSGGRRIVSVYDLDDTLERATDDLRALADLMILTGHIADSGEGLLLLRSDCNGEGARLAGMANKLEFRGIRAALVMLENPVGNMRPAAAIQEMESLVVIDHFMTETAQKAQVVLPASTLAETDGTVVSCDRRLGVVRMASRPRAGLTTGDILFRISAALGKPPASADPVRIRADFAESHGIPGPEFEFARTAGLPIPVTRTYKLRPQPIHIESRAGVGDFFPYATLDAFVDKKLAELGVNR
jgi:formate dehydrogenase major subunit